MINDPDRIKTISQELYSEEIDTVNWTEMKSSILKTIEKRAVGHEDKQSSNGYTLILTGTVLTAAAALLFAYLPQISTFDFKSFFDQHKESIVAIQRENLNNFPEVNHELEKPGYKLICNHLIHSKHIFKSGG